MTESVSQTSDENDFAEKNESKNIFSSNSTHLHNRCFVSFNSHSFPLHKMLQQALAYLSWNVKSCTNDYKVFGLSNYL